MDNAKTLIIILHFGSIKDTLECLDSIEHSITSRVDTFVVNNGPDQNVESLLRVKHSKIIFHYAGPETGFAAGNNIGLRFSLEHGYRYSLLLNNDVIVEQDFLRPLIDTLDTSPDVALAGPAIYYYENADRLWSCGGRIRWWSGGLGGFTKISDPDVELIDVDYLPGACILVRNTALNEIGLLSEE